MKANYNKEKQESTSEVTLGSIYDLNKQFMEKEPCISEEALKTAQNEIQNWLLDNATKKYFMLLCHEQRDYTIFNLNGLNKTGSTNEQKCVIAAYDVIDCMRNRGSILSIHFNENQAFELWIKNPEGCFAYYLFPYGEAVLEY